MTSYVRNQTRYEKYLLFKIFLRKAPAECRKFESKMADVKNKVEEGENINFYYYQLLVKTKFKFKGKTEIKYLNY